MPHASDGSISYEAIFERYNSDLANTLGNLVNRTIAMTNKYFGGVVAEPNCPEELDDELKNAAFAANKALEEKISTYHIADAVEAVMTFAKRCNKYIDETSPWALAKDEEKKSRLATVLYNLLEGIRHLGILISPFMPEASEKIFDQLGCANKSYESLEVYNGIEVGSKVGTPVPLFARIDTEKMLAELEAKQEEIAAKEKTIEEIEGVAQIGIDDFAKVDLRVAQVVDCVPVKRAKKLLQLTLDDGTGKPRTVASGIAQWYKPEQLIGKKIIVVSNLKPAKLCGVESCGMILACDCSKDDVKVVFIDESMPNGAKIR